MGLFLLLLLSLFIRIIHVYTPFTSGAPLSGYQQWRIHDIYNLEKNDKSIHTYEYTKRKGI